MILGAWHGWKALGHAGAYEAKMKDVVFTGIGPRRIEALPALFTAALNVLPYRFTRI